MAAAINVLLFGRKQWKIAPFRYAGMSTTVSASWPTPQDGRDWLPPQFPLRCTQEPGDVLLLPGLWGHATVNLAPFVLGFSQLWCGKLDLHCNGDIDYRVAGNAYSTHESISERMSGIARKLDRPSPWPAPNGRLSGRQKTPPMHRHGGRSRRRMSAQRGHPQP